MFTVLQISTPSILHYSQPPELWTNYRQICPQTPPHISSMHGSTTLAYLH